MGKKRLYHLDVLRCICMIIIVYYHLTGCVNNWTTLPIKFPFQFPNGISFGGVAVSTFFMISGASLFYVNNKSPFHTIEFYKKRIIRILPLFWLTWSLFYFYNFYFRSFHLDNSIPLWRLIFTFLGVDQYVSAVTGLQTFSLISEWFLGCIIIIYALFPLLRKLFLTYPRALFLILFVSYVGLELMGKDAVTIDFNVGIRIFEFTVGMYLAKYAHHIKKIYTVSLLVLFLLLTMFGFDKISVHMLTTFMALTLYLLCFHIFGNLSNEKIKNVLIQMSNYSYAVFLNHHVIMTFVFLDFNSRRDNLISSFREATVLILIVVILIVFCSYYLVKLERTIVGFCMKKRV